MKTSQLVWLLIGIVLLAAFSTYFYRQTFVVLAQRTIPADVVVKGVGGLNLDTDRLHFGGVPPGDYAQRKIHISYTRDSHVQIMVKGDLAQFTSISENDFFLPANERKDINFTASIPENTTFGNYTGTIFLTFLRP